jgi:hypothetical protein
VKGQIELVLRWACPCENNEELQVVSRLPAWANYAMGEATFREAWAQFAGEIKAHSLAAPSVEQDERGAWDGDSEESRAAFRAYDAHEPVSTRSSWQIWRDACAWQARAASTSANVAQGAEAVQFVFPPMPQAVVIHEKLGPLFDRLSMHFYADKCMRIAAPPAQTALTDDARWIDASKDVPGDEREVIVFLNGHCGLLDDEARKGGGWGIRLGWYDHDKRAWYVHGQKEHFVTHWQDEPSSPRTAAHSASGDTK